MEEKIDLFFSLYDLENHGYLTSDDMVKMLMNYPIAHIDNIISMMPEQSQVVSLHSNSQVSEQVGIANREVSMDANPKMSAQSRK